MIHCPLIVYGGYMKLKPKVFDELFKILKIIDNRWGSIIARKDESIPCGNYCIKKKFDSFDDLDEYWEVSIEVVAPFTTLTENLINFYSKSTENGSYKSLKNIYNPYGEALVFTSFSDDLTSYVHFNDKYGSASYEENYRIPYDRSSGVEEREFAIDLEIEDENIRDLMKRIVQFQHADLKNVNIIVLNYGNLVALEDSSVYNELINRPFFKGADK